MSDLIQELRDASYGYQHPKIAWPHQLLRDAADALAAKDTALSEITKERDGMWEQFDRLRDATNRPKCGQAFMVGGHHIAPWGIVDHAISALDLSMMRADRILHEQKRVEKAEAALSEMRAELERARKALEPFSKEAAAWSDMWEDSFVPIFDTGHLCEHCGHANGTDMKAKFTVGDLRRARALASQDEGEDR